MQIQNKTFDKSQAFTLIELLVVISIIGLLSTLAITSLNSAKMKARDAKRKMDIKMIFDAVEIYNIDNGTYPDNYTDCSTGGIAWEWSDYICSGSSFYKGSNVYLANIPTDPREADGYYYSYQGVDYSGYTFPCISSYLENPPYYFVCQNNTCRVSNGDNIGWCI